MFSMPVMLTVWRRELTPPHSKLYRHTKHISNIDKEVNGELSEDDLIEDRNMLECFLKCFK